MPLNSTKSIQRITLIVTSFASFVTPFIGSANNIALPSIGKDFTATAVELSWVATSFLLSAAVFLAPFGRIADIIGRKKVFNWGLIIFAVSSFFCAFSPNISILITLRIFQGMGGALITASIMAIITSVFPREIRGKAIGIVVAAVYVGLTLGPFLGGILIKTYGWESVFLFTIPFAILSLILSLIFLKEDLSVLKKEPFDWKGSLIFSVAIVSLIYGFTKLPEINGVILTLTGVICTLIFIVFEKNQNYPVINIKLFQENKIFAYSNYTALIVYASTFATSFLLSLFLQYIKGLNPLQTGQIIIIQPVLMAAFSPLAGKLSDKINPGKVATVGIVFIIIGLLILSFIQQNSSIWFIIPLLVIFGIGYALFSSPNTNDIMSSVEKKDYGLASGAIGTMRIVGQMSSMGITTMIFSIILGNTTIKEANFSEFILGTRTILVSFTIFSFIAIYTSYKRIKFKTHDHSRSTK